MSNSEFRICIEGVITACGAGRALSWVVLSGFEPSYFHVGGTVPRCSARSPASAITFNGNNVDSARLAADGPWATAVVDQRANCMRFFLRKCCTGNTLHLRLRCSKQNSKKKLDIRFRYTYGGERHTAGLPFPSRCNSESALRPLLQTLGRKAEVGCLTMAFTLLEIASKT